MKSYLEQLKSHDLILELADVLADEKENKRKLLDDLYKKVQQRKHKATTPGEFMHFNWIQNHIKDLLR